MELVVFSVKGNKYIYICISYYRFPLCVFIYFICLFVAYGLLRFPLKFVTFGTNG